MNWLDGLLAAGKAALGNNGIPNQQPMGQQGGVRFDINRFVDQTRQAPSLAASLMGNQLTGYNAAGNIGQQTMGAFGQANALNSANAQNQHGLDAAMSIEHMKQRGLNERLGMISPMLSQALGMGGGGALGNIKTNYGAGVSLTPQQSMFPNGSVNSGGGATGGMAFNPLYDWSQAGPMLPEGALPLAMQKQPGWVQPKDFAPNRARLNGQ